MRARNLAIILCALQTVFAVAVLVIAVRYVISNDVGDGAGPGLVLTLATLLLATCGFLCWLTLERLVMRPGRKLARGINALLESRNVEQELALPGRHALAELAPAVTALADALRLSRRETHKAMQSATADLSEQKAWLEVILQGLTEGVLVCNKQHQIMLYNRSAVSILGQPDSIGLGRPLHGVLSEAPLQHTMERLEWRHQRQDDQPIEFSAPFVCTSVDSQRMFHGRMALMHEHDGGITGYLVTLVDISADLGRMAQIDNVRRVLTRDLRGMVGNLRAAAETSMAYPDMSAEERASFDQVINKESERLSDAIDDLAKQIHGYNMSRWPMADVFVGDLVNCLEHRLSDLPAVHVQLAGTPLWVHGDSLSLMLALDCLLRQLHEHTGAELFEMESLLGDRRVYLDISWAGKPLSSDVLNRWFELPCGYGEPGGQSLGDTLERHGCEPWSQASDREGHASLRLPLMDSRRPQFMDEERLPARPEFYDFGLMQDFRARDALADKRLSELSFVVFDCEMTGLNPEQGDEIIAIAGVRVVNGRVLTGETFDRLINPGRPIPAGSIRFHGITDQDVADKPAIAEVLPEFHTFAGDAVLVAHNAAFDMKFITLKQRLAGVSFDNPVLDTLLLSALLEGEEESHSLDALCDRYGITISGRHTALGDAMATARLLVRFIERLQMQDKTTLGQVMRDSHMEAELRHRSAVFGAGEVGRAGG